MQITLALFPILAILPSVAAHGYVKKVVIDGTSYTGPLPADAAGASSNAPSPIRQIGDIGPVKGATNPDIKCGLSAQLASLVVPANPGSNFAFYWGNPSGGNWPHQVGPLMTYMAMCDTSTCDKFNGSTAKWFKIDELGKKSDGSTWYQDDVSNGDPVTLALPTQVAPGDYLVRHEIISLQNGGSPGGAEFYPSCTQIRVGGSQTGTPNQTVSFPGAYSDTDPGILDPDVYDPGSPYVFPGPPVSNLASPSDMSTSNGGQDNGSQSTPASPDDTTTTTTTTGSVPTDTTSTSTSTSTGTGTTSTSMYGIYGAEPTQSDDEQTQPSVESTQTGVDPTQSSVYSSQSDAEPSPTPSDDEPTQSGLDITQSGDQPTPYGAEPTQSGYQPAPSGSGVPHTRTGIRSSPSGVEPTQPGTGPTDSSDQPAPSGSGTPHTRTGVRSSPSGAEPTQPGTGPTDSSFEPMQSGTQYGDQPTPSGDQPTPTGAGPMQSGGGGGGGGSRTHSGSGVRHTRTGGGPSQSGYEPSQTGVEPTPSGDQSTSPGDQPTPSDVEPTQTQSGDQPAETSPVACGSQRRDASNARRNNRAQRKRRAHPLRGLRRARHP